MPGHNLRQLLAVAIVVLAGCPSGKEARIEGTWSGPRPERVLLIAPSADPLEASISSGSFAFSAGPVSEARVLLVGERGATTTSAKLSVAATTTRVAVEPLALWPARVEVQRQGDRLRFSWSRFPAADARYSLLFAYEALRDGARVRLEGSLVVTRNEAVQTLEELAAVLPERDPGARTIEVQVRAYHPRPDTPSWAGEVLAWTVPEDLPALPR